MKPILFFFYFLWTVSTIYAQNIKTIQLKMIGEKFSTSIVPLGSTLQLSFDDLSGNDEEYQYKITHMTADWQESSLLPSQYIEGFDQNTIVNSSNSFNTLQDYTHYVVTIPNQNTRITKSGNYLLSVLDEYDEEVFSRRFTLYEKTAIVGVHVTQSRNTQTINEQQTVQFTVNYPNLRINNPNEEIKVVILQNDVWQTAITHLQPTFYKPQQLVYNYTQKTNFWGGNEFLNFDNKILRNKSLNIVKIEQKEVYHHYLYPYEYREFKTYKYNPDINGQFLIRSLEGNDARTEADYVQMHFTLQKDIPFDEDIYVFGAFNNFELSEENRLKYNNKTQSYQTTILLKQGFYNYTFVAKTNDNKIDIGKIRGNFSNTENKYTVLVYFKPFGGLYERVIGIGTIYYKGEQ